MQTLNLSVENEVYQMAQSWAESSKVSLSTFVNDTLKRALAGYGDERLNAESLQAHADSLAGRNLTEFESIEALEKKS
ncbi:MAG: hypothetical protein LBP75_11395 [Planctomycetota bacterium]|jgi:hypothetical protein|nr:hypothetical protein [Planctomycetota bacterium]